MLRRAITPVLMSCAACALFSCSDHRHPPTDGLEVAVGLYAGALSDDGRYAIAGSTAHGVSLWQVPDAERLYDWNHKDNEFTPLLSADFSPDARYALTADATTLVLWDIENGKALRYWAAPSEILTAKLSHDAQFALLGLDDHTAVLFDVQRGGIRRTLRHDNRVRSVDLSADMSVALTGSEDFSAIAWNLETSEKIKMVKHEDDVQLVKLSPDGNRALSVSKYDKAIVWTVDTGELLFEVPLAAEHIKRGLRFTSAQFSSDNRYLLTGRPDQIVSLWDVETKQLVREWKVPKRRAWKPTGAQILDLAFGTETNIFYAIASSGYVHTLELK